MKSNEEEWLAASFTAPVPRLAAMATDEVDDLGRV